MKSFFAASVAAGVVSQVFGQWTVGSEYLFTNCAAMGDAGKRDRCLMAKELMLALGEKQVPKAGIDYDSLSNGHTWYPHSDIYDAAQESANQMTRDPCQPSIQSFYNYVYFICTTTNNVQSLAGISVSPSQLRTFLFELSDENVVNLRNSLQKFLRKAGTAGYASTLFFDVGFVKSTDPQQDEDGKDQHYARFRPEIFAIPECEGNCFVNADVLTSWSQWKNKTKFGDELGTGNEEAAMARFISDGLTVTRKYRSANSALTPQTSVNTDPAFNFGSEKIWNKGFALASDLEFVRLLDVTKAPTPAPTMPTPSPTITPPPTTEPPVTEPPTTDPPTTDPPTTEPPTTGPPSTPTNSPTTTSATPQPSAASSMQAQVVAALFGALLVF